MGFRLSGKRVGSPNIVKVCATYFSCFRSRTVTERY